MAKKNAKVVKICKLQFMAGDSVLHLMMQRKIVMEK